MTRDNTTESAAPPVVLMVDDEPDLEQLVLQKFRRRIRAGEMRFHFAHDGQDALRKLEENPEIEVVVTDLNMPNMDGLALLMQMRTRHPLVKAVIVSAYGDLSNIRSAMNRGAFDFLTKPLDFNDFERTVAKTVEHVRALQGSVRSLEENRILRLFVDESALHFMQRQPDQRTQPVITESSVAFIDICSFTSLTERTPPEMVISLLNRYFDIIARCAQPESGVIDKFIGDAAMLTFRGDDHKIRAVRTCLAARGAIAETRGEMEEKLGFFPEVATGLNAGPVLAGTVGAQSLGRLDYTLVGDAVNTAARLQSVAGPGDIIVSEEFLTDIRGRLDLEDRGVHALRGKAEPKRLYSIRGLRPARES
jgi:adenylate cyclase